MTKTVNYRGKQYTVPDWVKFIATDLNGSIFGYEMKPAIDEKEDFFEMTAGRTICLGWPTIEEWRDTLQEVD